MNLNRGFSTVLVAVSVVVVLAIGGAITAFLYVTSTTNPKTESNAYSSAIDSNVSNTDSEIGFKPPETATNSTALPTTITRITPPPASSPNTAGQVDVSSALSTDKKTLVVNFKSSTNFSGIISISYTVTYDSGGLKRSLQGDITADHSVNIISKSLTLGTCSGTNCVYDSNPTNFRVSVTTK